MVFAKRFQVGIELADTILVRLIRQLTDSFGQLHKTELSTAFSFQNKRHVPAPSAPFQIVVLPLFCENCSQSSGHCPRQNQDCLLPGRNVP